MHRLRRGGSLTVRVETYAHKQLVGVFIRNQCVGYRCWYYVHCTGVVYRDHSSFNAAWNAHLATPRARKERLR